VLRFTLLSCRFVQPGWKAGQFLFAFCPRHKPKLRYVNDLLNLNPRLLLENAINGVDFDHASFVRNNVRPAKDRDRALYLLDTFIRGRAQNVKDYCPEQYNKHCFKKVPLSQVLQVPDKLAWQSSASNFRSWRPLITLGNFSKGCERSIWSSDQLSSGNEHGSICAATKAAGGPTAVATTAGAASTSAAPK
jgi:hypothetical protein